MRPRSGSVPTYLPSIGFDPRFTSRFRRFNPSSVTGTANVYVEGAYDRGGYSHDTGARRNMKGLLEEWINSDRDIAIAITSISLYRRVFRTKNRNFIGIAHECIERGDVVALVAGASTPFVFRPVHNGGDDMDKRFALVGSAYVHGIMYGELTETQTPLAAEFKRMVVV
ncbi:hypothetical protein MFIFM68171_09372 [Madurella fahalii]|uniref:Uncharacterized protein n=1 Tax=Madurella fahalii TaxID=1157608 RepID=A0ABQ0GN23_9PEZI